MYVGLVTHTNEYQASMGPRLCRRGNVIVAVATAMIRQLQWGHVFVDVEIKLIDVGVSFVTEASMGPRLCRRGNSAGTTGSDPCPSGFNGATSL